MGGLLLCFHVFAHSISPVFLPSHPIPSSPSSSSIHKQSNYQTINSTMVQHPIYIYMIYMHIINYIPSIKSLNKTNHKVYNPSNHYNIIIDAITNLSNHQTIGNHQKPSETIKPSNHPQFHHK